MPRLGCTTGGKQLVVVPNLRRKFGWAKRAKSCRPPSSGSKGGRIAREPFSNWEMLWKFGNGRWNIFDPLPCLLALATGFE